jgi:hypothetical protein
MIDSSTHRDPVCVLAVNDCDGDEAAGQVFRVPPAVNKGLAEAERALWMDAATRAAPQG